MNLYEYDLNAADPREKVSLIATDLPQENGSANPEGVLRVSEDG